MEVRKIDRIEGMDEIDWPDGLNSVDGMDNNIQQPTSVQVIGGEARVGDSVLLRPSARADAFDLMLAGKTASIVAIQQDYEERIYVVVTVDDDPGRIQDEERIMPGHRFFFFADEVELLKEIEMPWRRE
jgi:hypothetical protein